MKRVIYVDYENVNLKGLEGIERLGDEDMVKIFIGAQTSKLSMKDADRIFNSDAHVELITNTYIGKNALDFIIMVHMGYDIAKELAKNYYVISKDKGYDPAIHEMRKVSGCTILRRQEINETFEGKVSMGRRILGKIGIGKTAEEPDKTQHQVVKKQAGRKKTPFASAGVKAKDVPGNPEADAGAGAASENSAFYGTASEGASENRNGYGNKKSGYGNRNRRNNNQKKAGGKKQNGSTSPAAGNGQENSSVKNENNGKKDGTTKKNQKDKDLNILRDNNSKESRNKNSDKNYEESSQNSSKNNPKKRQKKTSDKQQEESSKNQQDKDSKKQEGKTRKKQGNQQNKKKQSDKKAETSFVRPSEKSIEEIRQQRHEMYKAANSAKEEGKASAGSSSKEKESEGKGNSKKESLKSDSKGKAFAEKKSGGEVSSEKKTSPEEAAKAAELKKMREEAFALLSSLDDD
ncbi:MAG: hypothetical protein K5848_00925 [Lachnospiraceae bacterium]|nr:hypothetical protein [Lachnospiraceae bacterium]